MKTEVEETVTPETTETASAPKGSDAFKAARASVAAQSTDQEPEAAPAPAKDDTTDTPPAEEPAVTDQPSEVTEPTDALLTPEELAALSPKERAKAEKWQAKLTQESQRQAAQRKELEGMIPLVEALKTNPQAALEEIAKQHGLTLTRNAQDTQTVQARTAEVMAELPQELDFLKPILEGYGQKIIDSLRGEITPIKEAHAAMISEAVAAETQSTLEAFSAKYPDWKKHEPKMLELGKKFIPTAGAMTDFEYMETLHNLATMNVAKAEQTKKAVARINKAAASSEAPTSGMSNERVEHALPPPEKRSMRDAFNAAKRGERWVK
jgi:small-conductance mechanosensitive channel